MRSAIRLIIGFVLIAVVIWLVATALIIGIAIAVVAAIVTAILVALGLKPKAVVRPDPHDPLAIGVYTDVEDYAENGTRWVDWSILDSSWDEFDRALDRFLREAVSVVANVYEDKPVEWLVILYEPPVGTVSVEPSQGPEPDSDEEPRVRIRLHSQLMEVEFAQARKSGELSRNVWRRISAALRTGAASAALAEVRTTHPMRLAGYDYYSGADLGPSRLTETGEERRLEIE